VANAFYQVDCDPERVGDRTEDDPTEVRRMTSGKTRLLALIGHPVEHSLSPAMRNASFTADGLDYVYVALDVKPEDLPAVVRGVAALGFRGFNVTMPHKRAILSHLDDVDEGARISGAVNTVVVEESGLLRGHNTDGGGMLRACREARIELGGRRILLLGAGGVAAIALAFGAERIEKLLIANRSVGPASELTHKLRGACLRVEVFFLDALNEAALKAEVIVNATALGMKDGDPLPLPVEDLSEERGSATRSTVPAGRQCSSGKPANGVSGSSQARGCCSTRRVGAEALDQA
jgi:shikimate dehydrogenase